MTLAEKIRYLREVEGELRGLGRAMTQQELVQAIARESSSRVTPAKNGRDGNVAAANVAAANVAAAKGISQPYLSQIESGARPHLTNTTRLLLARFFKVHPGYLVDDPEGFQAELGTVEIVEDQLDLWLVGGAERFGRRDPELCRALLALAQHDDSRGCLLLLEAVLRTPGLVERLSVALGLAGSSANGSGNKAARLNSVAAPAAIEKPVAVVKPAAPEGKKGRKRVAR